MTTQQKIREITKILSIPLMLVTIYLIMYALWSILGLPSDEQLLPIIKDSFSQYGLWIVFIGALIEGFFLLGQYFPGGFIIFLGVISAGKDIPRATEVVSVVCLSFFIAYSLNYFVGKYGWYKLLKKFGLAHSIEKSKAKLVQQGMNAIFFSYWEPNLASFTATAAGVLKVPFKIFSLYSAMGIVLWNIFWGTLVYSLGESALQLIGLKYVIIIFSVWIGILLLKKYIFTKKTTKT